MLSAGVSVGVASTFGTPVGGVLFSIEVTSIYYMISAYAKCMIAAIVGMPLLFDMLVACRYIQTNGSVGLVSYAIATWFRFLFKPFNVFYTEIGGFPFNVCTKPENSTKDRM